MMRRERFIGRSTWRTIASLLVLVACRTVVAEELPWRVNKPIVTVKRELYHKQEHPDYPIWAKMYSTGPGLERWEVVEDESSGADEWVNIRSHVSKDNGRTWSEYEKLPNNIVVYKGVNVWEGDDLSLPLYDPNAGVLVQTWLRQIQQKKKPQLNFTYYRLSHDHGRTWSEPRQLKYEPGPDFDPQDPLNAEFIAKNNAYLPPNIARLSNGTLVLCTGNVPDPQNERKGVNGEEMGAVCFMGRWNAAKEDYDWTAGSPVFISPTTSSRGLLETNVTELRDGRLLVVWRGSNARIKNADRADAAGHKLFSTSSDSGKTLSPVQEWKYDDGSSFYSPSSFHRLFRHSVTGKLYWVGNISAIRPNSNDPRYPLVIAEVDEKIPALKRDTVTAIADRKPGDSERFQLSNFSILENPENHTIELLMVDYDSHGDRRSGDCYKYTLEFSKQD